MINQILIPNMKSIGYLLTLVALLFSSCAKESVVKITIQNQSDLTRTNEMVEVDWNLIKDKLRLGKDKTFVLLDDKDQKIPYQIVTNGNKDPKFLIFQVTMLPQQQLKCKVQAGVPDSISSLVLMEATPQVITWENEHVAFRLYGGELEMAPTKDLLEGGFELWVKRTPHVIAGEWYKDALAGVRREYRQPGPSGSSFPVGKTLGAGAASPYQKDTFYYANVPYSSYEILDNGPLRVVVKLNYKPYYAADSVLVNETRTISLDAGSNLNKVIEHYGDIKKEIQVAAGFPYYGNETYVMNGPEGYLAYAQPEIAEQGTVYLGIVSDVALVDTRVVNDQLIGVMNYRPTYSSGRGLTYYSGGGWSKDKFPTMQDWNNYIANYAARVRHPLIVAVD